ncbi:MAG: hypothetical protein MJ179_04950 [Treponema sp.]|nr:hypothetical protein [Treponema sp.]
MNNSSAFSTPLAISIIFSLFVVLLALSFLLSTNQRLIGLYQSQNLNDIEIRQIVDEMKVDFQELVNYEADMEEGLFQTRMYSKYAELNICIEDVSTGINKRFLNKEILENKAIKSLLAEEHSGYETDYGWINATYIDKSEMDLIKADFETEDLFPLVNSIPLYNINYMDEAFLKAVLDFCGIKNAEEKVYEIKMKKNQIHNKEELAKILGCSHTHHIFNFLGFKTTFWRVRFEKHGYEISVIFAAFPEKENDRKIYEYKMVGKILKTARVEI